MLIYENDEKIEEYDKFIKVDRPLTPKITELTGITEEMLKNEGVSERTVAQDLMEKLTPGTVMVAHNAQFDLSFIYYLLVRHFPFDVEPLAKKLRWIDTLTVLKDRKDYPHTLKDSVEFYGLENVNYHRAIDDTKALYEVVQAMKEKRNDLEGYLNLFGYNPKYPVDEKYQFSFIDYLEQPYHYDYKYEFSPDNPIPEYKTLAAKRESLRNTHEKKV